jgi:hypothetical protein
MSKLKALKDLSKDELLSYVFNKYKDTDIHEETHTCVTCGDGSGSPDYICDACNGPCECDDCKAVGAFHNFALKKSKKEHIREIPDEVWQEIKVAWKKQSKKLIYPTPNMQTKCPECFDTGMVAVMGGSSYPCDCQSPRLR